MRNSTIVYQVKMEYVSKTNIFGLSNGEKWSRTKYFEIPPYAKPFLENIFYFIEGRIFAQNCKFSNKAFFAHGEISIIFFVM